MTLLRNSAQSLPLSPSRAVALSLSYSPSLDACLLLCLAPGTEKRGGYACNPQPASVSTKLILFKPQRINPSPCPGCWARLAHKQTHASAHTPNPQSYGFTRTDAHPPAPSPHTYTHMLFGFLILISTGNSTLEHKEVLISNLSFTKNSSSSSFLRQPETKTLRTTPKTCKPNETLLLVKSLWRRAKKMWTHSLRGSGCTGHCYGHHLLPGCRPGPGCCSWWTSPTLWGPPALWWWWCFASRPILRSKETDGRVQNLFRSNLWSIVILSFSSATCKA